MDEEDKPKEIIADTHDWKRRFVKKNDITSRVNELAVYARQLVIALDIRIGMMESQIRLADADITYWSVKYKTENTKRMQRKLEESYTKKIMYQNLLASYRQVKDQLAEDISSCFTGDPECGTVFMENIVYGKPMAETLKEGKMSKDRYKTAKKRLVRKYMRLEA